MVKGIYAPKYSLWNSNAFFPWKVSLLLKKVQMQGIVGNKHIFCIHSHEYFYGEVDVLYVILA